MKKFIFKLISILSIFTILIGANSIDVANAESNVEKQELVRYVQGYEDEILGKANNNTEIEINKTQSSKSDLITPKNILPNKVVLDWVATENSIILKITNWGLDSVDLVYGTIDTGNMKKNFNVAIVRPGTSTHTITGVPLLTCKENIKITWSAKDGENVFASSVVSTGSREIPSDLLNLWSPGSKGSRSACLDYHFNKHGKEVSASNICQYVRMADNVRKDVIKKNLKPIRSVPGATANCYRYEYGIYYLHVVCVNDVPSGDLVSFGKKY
ncbi:hypothetical protein PL321_13180 [Caloramator sp. mosi_1]|uniref:hypothetical protein n=1 Tax=Caloramator sp. mosi_1 TaxID=3023090 RepID=UPI0023624682|nr:hypothetical protein [Caloramator sp. mosi_1]WDC83596.1 hypothetical protein PL321_13180 [Caloramator sp. mosi_1]